jgi:hypothetical protein
MIGPDAYLCMELVYLILCTSRLGDCIYRVEIDDEKDSEVGDNYDLCPRPSQAHCFILRTFPSHKPGVKGSSVFMHRKQSDHPGPTISRQYLLLRF